MPKRFLTRTSLTLSLLSPLAAQPSQRVTIHTDPPRADVYLRGSAPGNEKYLGRSGEPLSLKRDEHFSGAWEVVLRHPNYKEKLERIVPGNERWPAQGEVVLQTDNLLLGARDASRRHPYATGLVFLAVGALGTGLLYQHSKTKSFQAKEKALATLNERLIAAGGVLPPGVNQFETLDNYYLLYKIKSGGMGAVSLAVSQEDAHSGRPIETSMLRAIKVILPEKLKVQEPDQQPEGEGLSLLARFEREARLSLQVNHPNCLRTFEFHNQGAVHYLVMEYLPGNDLADEISTRKENQQLWSFKEAFALFRQMCAGIQACHDKGMIHRDLKPDNIKIVHPHTAKIIDFGLARRMGDLETTVKSRPEDVLGNEAYVPPEYLQGVKDDPTIDQFGLGLIFYEMLTGTRRIYNGQVMMQFFQDIVEPSYTALPHLPKTLVDALDRMMAPNYKDRYNSVASACLQIEKIARQNGLL